MVSAQNDADHQAELIARLMHTKNMQWASLIDEASRVRPGCWLGVSQLCTRPRLVLRFDGPGGHSLGLRGDGLPVEHQCVASTEPDPDAD